VSLVVAWSLAIQAAALRRGVLGLHPFPRRFRALWPILALAAALLFGWAMHHRFDEAGLLTLLACAPLGALLTVLLATLAERRPERRWLTEAEGVHPEQSFRAEPLCLPGHSDAGALLLQPCAPSPPRAVVVVLHGGGNDRLFGMSFLFERLIAQGYAVVTAHLPGHGRGATDSFTLESCRSRVDQLSEQARRRLPAARLVLLGQSLGGALALDHVARDCRVDAVVVVSTPAALRLSSRLGRELAALLRPSLYRALAYANAAEALPAAGRFKRDAYPVRLEAGPSYVEAFARAVDSMDLLGRLPRQAPCPLPVLLVHGGRDGVVPPADSRRLAAALGGRAEARIFDGVTHLDPLLDRTVVAEIVRWIDGQES
jgi:alpha-beta hydrolase superfamily lysophospholipase